MQVDGEAYGPATPPPALGEQSDEIYAEFGLSAEEISALRAENVI